MELSDSFTVPVSADRLWEVLTDVERIAPCVPGFDLKEVDDPDYRGTMKVKVGAIGMAYDTTITFVERDDSARRVVLSVKGKERRGPGGVDARVTSTLTENGAETTAEMVTDVQITGRISQFGRGIIADVNSRLTEQFVDCLNDRVLAEPAESGEPDAPDAGGSSGSGAAKPPAQPMQATTAPATEAAPLDLGSAAALPVLKRVLPALAAVVVAILLIRWLS
jgi:carbon monoxide dehydrogenase subunit G